MWSSLHCCAAISKATFILYHPGPQGPLLQPLVSPILPSIDIAMIWQVCHSAVSRATESSRGVYVCASVYLCRDTQEEVYHESLGHAIMKAEKSHSLPSESWGPRIAGGVVSVQIQRHEVSESRWYKSQFEYRRPMSQLMQTSRKNSPLLCFFVLFRPSVG